MLNDNLPIALYQQLVREFTAKIKNNAWPVGCRLRRCSISCWATIWQAARSISPSMAQSIWMIWTCPDKQNDTVPKPSPGRGKVASLRAG